MNKKVVTTIVACIAFLLLVSSYVPSTMASNLEQTDLDKPISTSGQWEFYWQELLEPSDFALREHRSESSTTYIIVPQSWRNQLIDGEPLPRFGYGTYRTTFAIPAEDIGSQQVLSLYYVGSAYRIWINGEEYPGLGRVGTTKEEEVPQLQRNLILFSPKEETIDVVLQVSNFSFREGGIISKIQYGDASVVGSQVQLLTYIAFFEIGAALIFGMYHLIIYFVRKNDIVLFQIGLLALFYSIRTLLITEHVVHLFFPGVRWETIIKLEYIIETIALLLIILIVRNMYPQEANRYIVRFAYGITSVFLGIILFTPSEVYTSLLVLASVFAILLVYFIVESTIKAKRRKREDANAFAIGVFILLVAVVNDILNYMFILDTFYMFKYVLILFIILQAGIVSHRYARLNDNNTKLTKELIVLNNTLEEKIEQRTEELRVKNEQLEQSQTMRTKMLANIAHDIGTPLAGVRTYLQIMKGDKIKVDKPTIFDELIDKVSYIQHLNQDLLELSKLESKKLSLDMTHVLLRPFLYEIVQKLQHETASKSTKLQIGTMETTIDGQEASIFIDRIRIMQVLQNYVTNAIKYNDAVEKIITLHCYIRASDEMDNEAYEAIIEIEDNGKGISESEIPYIFEQFYRKVEGNIEGSGLGLAIVKEIIEQHGGRVGAKNKKEAGAIFYFTLPASLIAESPRSDFSHGAFHK